MSTSPWQFAEPSLEAVLQEYGSPLDELAWGNIPAIVLRGSFPQQACSNLIDKLVALELLYDPRRPVPEKFIESAIPEGYYREGRNSTDRFAWQSRVETGRRRIDIGTSLGYRGSDPDDFLAHSEQTRRLFAELFANNDANPIRLVYDSLQALSRDKRVVTARESDGREYGPAIIRAHYGGYTYAPHFDSVRLREKRTDYAVHEFEHQFAGVLVLQNTSVGDDTAQCRLHRCLWQPDIDPHIRDGTFRDYAEQHDVESVEVVLEPGDLYFFNTRMIHEVPGVAGELPRVVLATFIGYSSDRDDIFVWS